MVNAINKINKNYVSSELIKQFKKGAFNSCSPTS